MAAALWGTGAEKEVPVSRWGQVGSVSRTNLKEACRAQTWLISCWEGTSHASYFRGLLKINWYVCWSALTCAGRVYSAKVWGLWCGEGWLLMGPSWMEHGQHVSSWSAAALSPMPCPQSWCACHAPGPGLTCADYGDCFTYVSEAGREDLLFGSVY